VTPAWFRRTLVKGASGPDVGAVQSILRCYPSGVMDEWTLAVVRGVQVAHGLPVTGRVDAETAAVIGPREREVREMPPEWFGQEYATAEAAVRRILGAADEDTVRRFQSAHQLTVTGRVDAATAVAMGD